MVAPNLPNIHISTGKLRFRMNWLGQPVPQLEYDVYRRRVFPAPLGSKGEFLGLIWKDVDKSTKDQLLRSQYKKF